MIGAFVLAVALVAQQTPAPAPVQRPAEITISVEEYARLKTCEAREAEKAKRKPRSTVWVIVAGAAIAIAAIVKRK